MLPLIACDHIYRLLQQIEVELAVLGDVRRTEVSVNKVLRPCVKQSINIGLVPAALLYQIVTRLTAGLVISANLRTFRCSDRTIASLSGLLV